LSKAVAIRQPTAPQFVIADDQQLVPVTWGKIGDEEQFVVNARDIHKFLKSGKDYTNWIKARIQKFNLIKNKDFGVFAQMGEDRPSGRSEEVFAQIVKNPSGGRPQSDYFVTIRIAKHLAMVENTERGNQVRDYFIECENRLHDRFVHDRFREDMGKVSDTTLDMVLSMSAELKESRTTIKELEAQIEEDKPNTEFGEMFKALDHGLNSEEMGDLLHEFGKNVNSRNKLITELKNRGKIKKENGVYVPTASAIRDGLLVKKKIIKYDTRGKIKSMRYKIHITRKGQQWILDNLS